MTVAYKKETNKMLEEIDRDTCIMMKLILKENKLKQQMEELQKKKSHFKLTLIKKYRKMD